MVVSTSEISASTMLRDHSQLPYSRVKHTWLACYLMPIQGMKGIGQNWLDTMERGEAMCREGAFF